MPTQAAFWTRQGFSEEEAAAKVSERQTTFSKEICIEKYGEEVGHQVWQERQDKWQATLDAKSPEEKIRILKAKASGPFYAARNIGTYGSVKSKAESELCGILGMESQFCIESDDMIYFYDMKKNNKIIEYNGDYWHCNPSSWKDPNKYNKSIKMTAQEKWKKDSIKLDVAKTHGYEVLVIWEEEWTADKQSVIEKCKRFIHE
jgi:hypothetical protein